MQPGCLLPVADIGPVPPNCAITRKQQKDLDTLIWWPPITCSATNPSTDHGSRRVGTTAYAYHDPFVLFGFLSGCTQRIGFAVGVLILAQRQAVLVAKRAASLDQLCERAP